MTTFGEVESETTFLLDSLTTREREVLDLLSQGLSNKQIANRLVLSPRTVEHHIAGLYAKLGVHTRAGAIGLALRHRSDP